MQVDSTLNIGVQGFQDAQRRATDAATEIASSSVTESEHSVDQTQSLTTSLVELKAAEIDANANAKVIQTASDVLGTIIDIEI
ncbi:MAG: hypothetical protein KUG78_03155 [Kangiellaceae bacterium]|nr:hypothetical protein [Kangiellaceae bacterium]